MIRFFRNGLYSCLIISVLSGCATMQTVRDLKGTGRSQIYDGSYDKVFYAALETMHDLSMEIDEKDLIDGRILAKKSMSYTSYGERIAIYFYKVDENKTKVEVISMKVLATNVFAKDWTDTIFESIRINVKNSK